MDSRFPAFNPSATYEDGSCPPALLGYAVRSEQLPLVGHPRGRLMPLPGMHGLDCTQLRSFGHAARWVH